MQFESAREFIVKRLETGLKPSLHYHNLHHTLDVLAVTETLCTAENIDPHHTQLLRTAALFHDSGFLIRRQEHELLGCGIAREALPAFGYSDTQIEHICCMIMATRIPQQPRNNLEAILSDADLDYLGRDDFYTTGRKLYDELVADDLLHSEEAWNRLQVSFISAHAYFTPTNRLHREPVKQQYLAELIRLVASYD